MSKNMLLEPDDFKIGMYLTVHTGPMITKPSKKLTPFNENFGDMITSEDNSFKGRVLKLQSINLPYIVVSYWMKALDFKLFTEILDIRGRQFMKLTNDFVKEADTNFKTLPYEDNKDPQEVWMFEQEIKEK